MYYDPRLPSNYVQSGTFLMIFSVLPASYGCFSRSIPVLKFTTLFRTPFVRVSVLTNSFGLLDLNTWLYTYKTQQISYLSSVTKGIWPQWWAYDSIPTVSGMD